MVLTCCGAMVILGLVELTPDQITVLRSVAAGEPCPANDFGLTSIDLLFNIADGSGRPELVVPTPAGLIALDLLEQLEEARDRHELLHDLYKKADALGHACAALDQGRHRMNHEELEAADNDVSVAFDAWTAAKAAYEAAGGTL